ncbi:MAG: hypothetical protein Q9227_002663 [Pyrenula ochraceoflavens]
MKHDTVTLDPVENLFKSLLIECRNFNSKEGSPWAEQASTLELRFTGGWVRDKLLGMKSHDIDVALSSMTGEQFGLMLQDYVKANGSEYEAQAKGLETRNIFSDLHRIKKNPEKSKHLETMATRIFGLDIDFVNLRKETYSEDSRNPQVECGTPQEDALRRDATINALFYNLDDDAVEDFTTKGLDDLRQGIIRTPLSPYDTFLDDPLRILRLIRFASKYGYALVKESESCMKDPKIQEALLRKITKDRVGVEIEKMFTGPNPHRAISYLNEFGLLPTVFQGVVSDPAISSTIQNVFDVLNSLIVRASKDQALNLLIQAEDVPYSWYLVAYVPWAEQTSQQGLDRFRDMIRASNKVFDRLKNACKYRDNVKALVNKAQTSNVPRSALGMAVRTWGPTWRLTVVFALLCEIYRYPAYAPEIEGQYQNLLLTIQRLGLENADHVMPIVNGDRMQKEFGLKKGGRWVGKALEEVLNWQFDNPDGAAEDLLAILKSRKDELGIPDPDK